jgi:hypothetical protein
MSPSRSPSGHAAAYLPACCSSKNSLSVWSCWASVTFTIDLWAQEFRSSTKSPNRFRVCFRKSPSAASSVRIERAKSQQINQSGAKPGAATDVTSIARYTRGIIYVLHLSNQISRRCLNRRFLLFIAEKNNCAPETALNESASKKCHIDYGASIVRHYYF